MIDSNNFRKKIYNVGDVITILSREDMPLRYSNQYDAGTDPDMDSFFGRKATITRKDITSNLFSLDIDGGLWNWTRNMFLESYCENQENSETNDKIKKLKLPTLYENKSIKLESILYYSDYILSCNPGFFTNNKNFLIIFKEDKFKIINLLNNNDFLFKSSNDLTPQQLGQFIKTHCKIRIKNYENSAKLFGYRKIKKIMFEKNNIIWNEFDKVKKKDYKISKIIFNYLKNDSYVHVIELISNNDRSVKFILDDLEIIPPNLDAINLPKVFNFKNQMEGKITRFNNKNIKHIPIKSKEETFKIIHIYNNHKPIKKVMYDSNSIAICKTKGGKEFKCRLKIIKPIINDYKSKVY